MDFQDNEIHLYPQEKFALLYSRIMVVLWVKVIDLYLLKKKKPCNFFFFFFLLEKVCVSFT